MAKLNFQHHYSSLHNKYFFIIIIIAENSLSGFCHFGLVSFMSFLTEPWHSRHCHVFMWVRGFECARAMRSLACVPCFELSVSCCGSDTRAPCSVSLCECAVSSSLGRALIYPRVFCGLERSLSFYRLRAFMLCLVLCGTQLVYLIGCVVSCCHVLCEHVAYEYSH